MERNKGMTVGEARIVLRCQSSHYPMQIWEGFMEWQGESVSYPQIAQMCKSLYWRGCLVRRKCGRKMFYQATQKGLSEAVKILNGMMEEKMQMQKNLMMMMINRRVTDFT